jgi:hypothetical protein
MKRLALLVIGLVFLFTTSVFAQAPPAAPAPAPMTKEDKAAEKKDVQEKKASKKKAKQKKAAAKKKAGEKKEAAEKKADQKKAADEKK